MVFGLLLVCASESAAAPGASQRAAEQLPAADGLYERWDPRRSWGTPHLINALEEVSQRVAFELPGADPLMIGDISRQGGGWLRGHITHTKGVDVDVGMFMHDARQPLGGFLDLRPSQLDVHANWVLVTSLLDTDSVQYMLLDQGHINALTRYAREEVGLDQDEIDTIFPPNPTHRHWRQAGVVRHAPNHLSHLHVRFKPPEVYDPVQEAKVPSTSPRSAVLGQRPQQH